MRALPGNVVAQTAHLGRRVTSFNRLSIALARQRFRSPFDGINSVAIATHSANAGRSVAFRRSLLPASVSDHDRSFLSASPYCGSPYCLEFQSVTVALHSPVMRTFDAPLARFLNGCAEYYESTFGRTCKTPKQSCVVTCQGLIPCRNDRLVAVTCRFRSLRTWDSERGAAATETHPTCVLSEPLRSRCTAWFPTTSSQNDTS